MVSSTTTIIWAKSRIRRTVSSCWSALTNRVVISHTHQTRENMVTVHTALCQLGWWDSRWEKTMVAATITRS